MYLKENDRVWSNQLQEIVKVGWTKPDKVWIWFIPEGNGGCWLPLEDLSHWCGTTDDLKRLFKNSES